MSAGINPESLFGCVRELQTASDSAQFLALEQQLGEEVRRASVAGADLSGDDRATLRDNALSVFHSCFEHSARLPQLVHAQRRWTPPPPPPPPRAPLTRRFPSPRPLEQPVVPLLRGPRGAVVVGRLLHARQGGHARRQGGRR